MQNHKDKDALEYTRNLYKEVLDWYKNADSKAQILLTIDGAFVAFLTGSIFSNPSDLSKIITIFQFDTWLLLLLMCICLVSSIICALNCLRSRTYSQKALGEMFKDLEKEKGFDINKAESYSPEVMGFFQIISQLDIYQFTSKLKNLNSSFILETLSIQIYKLSGNVCQKHRWVNAGFIFAGLTLILFLSGGVSYIIRVA